MGLKVWVGAGVLLGSLSMLTGGCSGCSSDGNAANAGGSAGTDGGTDGTAGSAGSGGLDRWTAWQQIQTALRASPDHLPAQAEAVVATKDPAQIFEFVRDKIATYPPAADSMYQSASVTRWGAKATLRGGAGTPREKAELLVALYEQAGFDAEVMVGTPDPALLDGKKVLLRTLDVPHAPAMTPDQISAWSVALGSPTQTPYAAIDPTGAKTSALKTQLLSAMPTDLASPFDFALPDIPIVRVMVDGAPEYANPIAPDAQFGETFTTGEPLPTGAAYPGQSILVRLEAARSDDPYTRFTLVERSFEAEAVVGRRIQIAFPPPAALETLAAMRIQDVETVVPVLSVIGLDMTQDEKDALAEVGDLLSFGGDVYEQAPGGGLTVNGEPVPDAITDPAQVAKVETVNLRANGSAFPRIGVTVSALDSTGQNVPRLGASAFEVREDGELVSFSLTRNEAPPPRVVLLYDLSTSLPPEFLGQGAVDLGNQIVQPLYAKYPAAEVRVAAINFGADWMSGTWATTLADAESQVQGLATAFGSSDIWTALYDAEKEKPTVILMVTDGDATDVAEPHYKAAVAAGVPVLSIAVGTVNQPVLDEISTLSQGLSVPVTQLSQATAAAIAEIDARAVEDYVLSYNAPKGTATTRNVTVTVNAKTGTDSYDVPAQPVTPKAFSGLYLTIGLPGREHTAAIAGFNLGYSTAFPTITQAMLDDVKAALLGRISIKVEAAAPSGSVLLDEWIGEKLAMRPVVDAAEARDETLLIDALEQGFSRTPAKLPLAQPPLVGAWSTSSLTFETGPRVAAMIQKFPAAGPVTRTLHLYPKSEWRTAAEDPRVAWEKTVEATAGLAVMEAELMNGPSTLEDLGTTPLTLMDPGQVDTQPGLTDEQKLAWAALESQFNGDYKLLVPLAPGPFWAIHEPTGTVIGMRPDGTGSGMEDVCNAYDQANHLLQLMGLVGSLFGVQFGGWAALAAWEVKYVTMATLVIGYGVSPGGLSNPGIDMGCGAINDAIGGLPGVGTLYGLYDAIASTYNDVHQGGAEAPTLCGGGYNPCGGG